MQPTDTSARANLYFTVKRTNELRITFMKNLTDTGYVFLGIYRTNLQQSDSTHLVWERVADECDLSRLDFSQVTGTIDSLKDNFDVYCGIKLDSFDQQYEHLFYEGFASDMKKWDWAAQADGDRPDGGRSPSKPTRANRLTDRKFGGRKSKTSCFTREKYVQTMRKNGSL